MEKDRKKQLIQEYKNRMPEMGVISLHCIETGESFLGISKDTRADYNSIRMKLESNFYPNKRLLKLWNTYGEQGFQFSLLKKLKYEDPKEDHTKELEKMREKCLEEDGTAQKMWK